MICSYLHGFALIREDSHRFALVCIVLLGSYIVLYSNMCCMLCSGCFVTLQARSVTRNYYTTTFTRPGRMCTNNAGLPICLQHRSFFRTVFVLKKARFCNAKGAHPSLYKHKLNIYIRIYVRIYNALALALELQLCALLLVTVNVLKQSHMDFDFIGTSWRDLP